MQVWDESVVMVEGMEEPWEGSMGKSPRAVPAAHEMAAGAHAGTRTPAPDRGERNLTLVQTRCAGLL